jgi:cell volume regulation protein A
MTLEQLDWGLLVGAAILLISIAAVRLSTGMGLPSLLAYLGLGLLIGEDGLGLEFDNTGLARALGTGALIVILIEGGLSTEWRHIRPIVPVATVLATVGLAVSIGATAVGAHLLLHFDWQLALLIGAVLSPTDAAAVFSVLRRVPMPRRLSGLLEAESGFNDAPSALLVVLLSTTTLGDLGLWSAVGVVIYQLVAGGAIGLIVGQVGLIVMRRAALPSSGLYPLAAFAFGALAYAVAARLHASGFLAAYVAGLVLGNGHLPHRPAVRSFAEGLAWLAQIGMFVMLGLLATPTEMWPDVLSAIALGLVVLLFSRPLSVVASLTPFRVPWREQAMLSWAGLRGAVPIVLATVPAVEKVPRSDDLFNIVFVVVFLLTALQGPTLPFVARRLGMVPAVSARDLEVESAPLGSLRAELLAFTIPDGSLLHGVEVFELRLPRTAAVTLVIRQGAAFVPDRRTTLLEGDDLLVVCTPEVRDQVEQRLRAISRRGKLARWFGEDGE